MILIIARNSVKLSSQTEELMKYSIGPIIACELLVSKGEIGVLVINFRPRPLMIPPDNKTTTQMRRKQMKRMRLFYANDILTSKLSEYKAQVSSPSDAPDGRSFDCNGF